MIIVLYNVIYIYIIIYIHVIIDGYGSDNELSCTKLCPLLFPFVFDAFSSPNGPQVSSGALVQGHALRGSLHLAHRRYIMLL